MTNQSAPVPSKSSMREFIQGMPKAELHLHLEGSIEPARMMQLARRNCISLRYPDEAALRAAYDFSGLQSFLDIYYEGCKVLRTQADFHDVAWDYLKRVHGENVVHAEIFLSAQANRRAGVAVGAMVEGVDAAMARARDTLGMSCALLLGMQRHLGEDDALATVQEALPYRDRIAGLGLGGAERPNPPAGFVRLFERARELGWHTMAHAGEDGPAHYVENAVDLLKVDRIDHGVRCEDDPALMQRLVDMQIPLTVCPVSNVELGVFASMKDHNIGRLLAAGLNVTINSDDPSYFDAYMNDNFARTQEALALGFDEIHRLARNGLQAAFMPEREMERHISALDAFRARFPA